jgi:hypothetical protein
VPIGLQWDGVLAAPHLLLPGMHDPPQLPLEQSIGQTLPANQVPSRSQVWGVRLLAPAHICVPGLHTPVQSPGPVQALGQGSAGTHTP